MKFYAYAKDDDKIKTGFYGAETEIKFADGTVQRLPASAVSVSEFTLDLIIKSEDVRKLPAMDLSQGDVNISFKVDIESRQLAEFFKPYNEVEVEFDGFITEKLKESFREAINCGYIFFVRFRQEIAPRLRTHVTFLTMLKVEQLLKAE